MTGFASLAALTLAACGGGGSSDAGSTPGPVQTGTPGPAAPASIVDTPEKASIFLNYATFGATRTSIAGLEDASAAEWIRDEIAKPATLLLDDYVARVAAGEDMTFQQFSREIWAPMITADDQLRQRMAFALSQILVVDDDNQTLRMAHYYDILSRHAFGNYRDLLDEVTYSPRMAEYLTYLNNRGDREDQGRMPDENYARELLQLFTIGLVELDMNGNPSLGPDGRPTEIYDNDDIAGLARVFTGLSHQGESFWRRADDGYYTPLIMWEQFHSPHEKSFLGLTIPAGTPGDESVAMALDHIFEHPNLAPFLSRQLIQRFTASSPDPAYVERVATAFENGQYESTDGVTFGTGERGDLAAVIAAILLDDSLLKDEDSLSASDGKIREPVLRFTQLIRAFGAQNIDAANERYLRDARSPSTRLAQHPFRSPSVFNFYRPGFVAPATESGEAGLTAPEFQIVNAASFVGHNNFMASYIQDLSPRIDADVESFTPDYSYELSLAEAPEDLVDHLDTLLTGGRMLEATRQNIIGAISELPLDPDGSPDTVEEDRLTRVELAVMMAIASPSYIVQR